MHTFISFLLFAFIASISPGPTNILVLGFSIRFGLQACLPVILGGCGAAALIVLLAGLGLGHGINSHPWLGTLLAWVGIAWLTLLSWKLFNASGNIQATDSQHSTTPRQRYVINVTTMQVINPKVWMMALAVVGIYAAPHSPFHGREWILALVFFIVAMPCMAVWAALGKGIAQLRLNPLHLQRFNQTMAVLLALSAWSMAPM